MVMRVFALALLALCVVAHPTYHEWLRLASPRFRGTQEAYEANLKLIDEHNSNPAFTWKMEVNKFAGLTQAEFKAYVKGYSRTPSVARNAGADLSALPPVSPDLLPKSVDWRTKNVVTPPKDQGGCGSCWAFSATETLESMVAIKTGTLLTLSEQQLVDCVPNPQQCGGSGGCNGATQQLGFNYTMENGGAVTEDSYPYQGVTQTCPSDLFPVSSPFKPAATLTGYVSLPTNNYTALKTAVALIGPIAISAAASSWQFYSSGVLNSCDTDIDHGIQLVGYGTDPSQGDYWLVRNSWSSDWGEDGYIRIARYGDKSPEPCGTDSSPLDGYGCQGGPSSITVCGMCGILSDSSYPTGVALGH